MTINENVNVNFGDGGSLDKLGDKATKIKDTLTAAATASTRVAGPVAAAKQGVANTNKQAMLSGREVGEDSSLARGVGGLTGAAGRDFAAQSRGLGGLVRVYATFAATIFAVSSAFTQLNKAANIENMIKGLDQLGAASGRNLGTLAKSLSAVSDGALALADSMTAVAQASAGGMSSENILRMGEVAKKASQALGRDMTDALNRLSRGITKIEPELLDELGIMVKIDEASRKYALQLGKTASSLTDFEKRQGYANAVLEEGEKKFGNVKLDANPYQKLLASFSNLALEAGKVINTVLGPLVKLLSESPTALGLALAYVTGLLIKQSIPAISAWKDNLAAAAKQAAISAQTINQAFTQFKDASYFKQSDALAEVSAQYKQEAQKILQTQKWFADSTKIMQSANDTNIRNTFSDKDINTAVAKVTRLKKEIASLNDSIPNIGDENFSLAAAKRIDNQIKILEGEKKEAELLVNKMQASKKYHDQFITLENKQLDLLDEKVRKIGTEEYIQDRIYQKAIRRNASLQALNKVGSTTETYGFSEGIAELRKNVSKGMEEVRDAAGNITQIATPALTGLNKTLTITKGLAIAATVELSKYLQVFGVWAAAIGGAVAVFQILDSFLSSNTKQAQAATAAMDTLSDAVLGIDNTLKAIENKDPLQYMSVESISARATAINELSNSMRNMFNKVKQQADSANTWDILIDTAKAAFGFGLLNNSAENLAKSVSKVFSAAKEGAEKTNALKDIGQLLKVDPRDAAALEKVLGESPQKFLELAPLVISRIEEMSQALSNTASSAKELDGAFTTAIESYDKIMVASIPTDPLAKLGAEISTVASKMKKALEDPENALAQLEATAKDVKRLRFFDESTANDLLKMSTNITKSTRELGIYSKAIEQIKSKQEELAKNRTKYEATGGRARDFANQTGDNNAVFAAEEKSLANSLAIITARKDEAEKSLAKGLDLLRKGQEEAFIKGSILIETSIGLGFQKAVISVQKTLADGIKDTFAGIELDASLQKQDIDLQIRQIDVQIGLIRATEALRRTQEEMNIALARENVENKLAKNELSKPLAEKLLKDLDTRELGLKTTTANTYTGSEGMKKFAQDRNNPVDYIRAGAEFASPTVTALYAAEQQKAGLAKAKETVEIKKQFEINAQIAKVEKDRLATELSKLETDKQSLDVRAKSLPYVTESLLKEIQLKEASIAENKEQSARLDILNKIKDAKLVRDSKSATAETKTAAENALREEEARLARFDERAKESAKVRAIADAETRKAEDKKAFDYRQELDKQEYDTKYALEEALRQQKEDTINSTIEAGLATSGYAIRAKAEIESDKEAARSAKALFDLREKLETDLFNITQKINAVKQKPGYTEEEVQILERQRDVAVQYYAAAVIGEARLTSKKIQNNTETATYLELLDRQKTIMEELVGATASLGLAFGKVGAGIGAVAVAFKKFSDNKKAIDAKAAKNEKDFAEDAKNEAAYLKDKQRLQEDATKNELNSYEALTAGAKAMFDEKTAAYKAMAAIEQGLAIARLYLIYQQMAAETQATAVSVSASATKAAAAGTEGTVAAAAQTPGPIWIKLAAGAAFAAFVASMLGSSKGVSTPSGFTAEDQQSVQGTGRSYSNGTLVENGGGALGDSSKKSTAIVDGINTLAENNFELLRYTKGKMYEALKGIESNTEQFVKLLINTLGLGGLNTQDSTSKSALGFSKKTVSVKDEGIILKGFLSDLMSGGGTRQQYENVQTEKSSWWGLKKSTSNTTNIKNLESATTEVINNIFKNFQKTLLAAADTLSTKTPPALKNIGSGIIGKIFSIIGLKNFQLPTAIQDESERIRQALQNFKLDIKVSSLGKTGEEFAAEVMAEIGIQLDRAAKAIFPNLDALSDKYQELGETTTDFLVRLVKTAEDVTTGLESIGKNVNYSNVRSMAEFSQALVEMMGGVQTFLSQTEFFRDNFLTESQRLVPVQKAVTAELERLGLGFVDTREEFANIVLGLDITTHTGQEMYAALMAVSEGFAEVYKEATKAADAETKYADLRSQYVEILELEGKKLQSTALAREIELEQMEEYLRVGQKYIWAMEDQADLANQVTAAYEKEADAIKQTIDLLNSQIESLNKYKDSLTISNTLSTLTPGQKYEETKTQLYDTFALANSIAVTDEEKDAKNKAIADLPNISNTFLEASRTLFASSAQYTSDFNSVLDMISTTTSALSLQKSIAEQQLDALEDMYSALNIIAEATYSLAQLVPMYLAAQQRTSEAALAYYAAVPVPPTAPPPPTVVAPTVSTSTQPVKTIDQINAENLIKEVQYLNDQIAAQRAEAEAQAAAQIAAAAAIAKAEAEAAAKAAAEVQYYSWIGGPYWDPSNMP
jgi:hypothetical protein